MLGLKVAFRRSGVTANKDDWNKFLLQTKVWKDENIWCKATKKKKKERKEKGKKWRKPDYFGCQDLDDGLASIILC